MMALLMACPVCFGAADSEQVRAAKVGVLVMLGFIVPLLVAIAFIARSWRSAPALSLERNPRLQIKRRARRVLGLQHTTSWRAWRLIRRLRPSPQ